MYRLIYNCHTFDIRFFLPTWEPIVRIYEKLRTRAFKSSLDYHRRPFFLVKEPTFVLFPILRYCYPCKHETRNQCAETRFDRNAR